jgi:hypothetical protein
MYLIRLKKRALSSRICLISLSHASIWMNYGHEGRVAPWHWDLLNPNSEYPGFKEAISAELRVLGVREDLCVMGVPSGEVEDELYGHWNWVTKSVVTNRSKETNSRLNRYLPEPVLKQSTNESYRAVRKDYTRTRLRIPPMLGRSGRNSFFLNLWARNGRRIRWTRFLH